MVKTWMPTVAGILNIITGGLTLLGVILVSVSIGVFYSSAYNTFGNQDIPAGIWVAIFLPAVILSIVAIVGGVYAIRRRIWGLALAGAICSLLTIWAWPLGIAAIVLLALSKHEFNHIILSPPPPPVATLPPPLPNPNPTPTHISPPPTSSRPSPPPPPPPYDSTKRPRIDG
jgi:hypothetical protein